MTSTTSKSRTQSTQFVSLCRVNVACGQAEERVLLTGLHAVADIYCECCKTPLGWKYVSRDNVNRWSFIHVFPYITTGTCLRVESEVQGGKVHHRTGAHDQGEQMGLNGLEMIISFNFFKISDEISVIYKASVGVRRYQTQWWST